MDVLVMFFHQLLLVNSFSLKDSVTALPGREGRTTKSIGLSVSFHYKRQQW
jgi:hypothetical protein